MKLLHRYREFGFVPFKKVALCEGPPTDGLGHSPEIGFVPSNPRVEASLRIGFVPSKKFALFQGPLANLIGDFPEISHVPLNLGSGVCGAAVGTRTAGILSGQPAVPSIENLNFQGRPVSAPLTVAARFEGAPRHHTDSSRGAASASERSLALYYDYFHLCG